MIQHVHVCILSWLVYAVLPSECSAFLAGLCNFFHSGCSATVAPFDEEEIVVGDLVKVELDPELFKMMHKAAGVWKDNMSAVKRLHLISLCKLRHHITLTCTCTKLIFFNDSCSMEVRTHCTYCQCLNKGGFWSAYVPKEYI